MHQSPITHKQELAAKEVRIKEMVPCPESQVAYAQDLAPWWLPGDGLYGEKSLIIVTNRVRIVASTDWLGLGVGGN